MKIGKESEKLEFKKTTSELKAGVISMAAFLNKHGGEEVELTAIPSTGYTFGGWYEDDELISTETTLTFTAEVNRTLEARFISCNHNYGEYKLRVPPNCAKFGQETRYCSECGHGDLRTISINPNAHINDLCLHIIEIGGRTLIEIHNSTAATASTKGMYLSGDDEGLFKWQMPGFIIRAGESLLIRGRDDDVTPVLKWAWVGFDVERAKGPFRY